MFRWLNCRWRICGSIRPHVVALGILLLRHRPGRYRRRRGFCHSRSTEEGRIRQSNHSGEDEASRYPRRSRWHHSTGSFQLCVEPGTNSRVGKAVCLRDDAHRHSSDSGVSVHRISRCESPSCAVRGFDSGRRLRTCVYRLWMVSVR